LASLDTSWDECLEEDDAAFPQKESSSERWTEKRECDGADRYQRFGPATECRNVARWRPRQWSPGAIQPVGKYRCHQHKLWVIAEQETHDGRPLGEDRRAEEGFAERERADPAISTKTPKSVSSVIPPSWSGSQTVPWTVTENCTTRSSYSSPHCATGTTVSAHGSEPYSEVAGETLGGVPSLGVGPWRKWKLGTTKASRAAYVRRKARGLAHLLLRVYGDDAGVQLYGSGE